MCSDNPLAHIDHDDGREQTLIQHSLGVSELAGIFGSDMGISNVGRLCGILHDIGKASSEFQQYLRGESGMKRGDVDHSTAGAQYLRCFSSNNSPYEELALQMMELSIVSHHSGLIDCISAEGKDVFQERLSKDYSKTHFIEIKNHIDPDIQSEVERLKGLAIKELVSILEIMLKNKVNSCFHAGLLERGILSCLMDADHQDTRQFFSGTYHQQYISWDVLQQRLESYMQMIKGSGKVNAVRSKVSDECYSRAASKQGIFTLSVPTGGGKTLASLRFAIRHAIENDLKRIVIVIPYMSIIEQNVDVIRKVLERENEKIVLEYHSGIDVSELGLYESRWRYYSDSWDAQIIVTTMVQFLNVLFQKGSGYVKKMHNLSKSVIIFDEIQTLPVKCTYMFNEAVNYLCTYCHSSIVLSTATQPLLSEVPKHPIDKTSMSEIISDPSALSDSLARTKQEFVNRNSSWSVDEIADFSEKISAKNNSVLVIVNTRSFAAEIYRNLKNRLSNETEVFHLSNNMCAAHRRHVLSNVRRLLGHKKVLCVSTQLIEAGVDIDFESVIRTVAGLDSMIQAAGRCNRNGERSELGKIYLIQQEEKISKLPEIYDGRQCSLDILYRFENPFSSEAKDQYYREYYERVKQKMEYFLSDRNHNDRSIFDMLSVNGSAVALYRNLNNRLWPQSLLHQSFEEANAHFKVIEETDSIIVPYDDKAKEIISEMCQENNQNDISDLLTKAQQYVVNVHDVESMAKKGMIKNLGDENQVNVLLECYYDSDIGITYEDISTSIVF